MNSDKLRVAMPIIAFNDDSYIHAVEALGAQALVYHTVEELDVNAFDCLLLPGGQDINPARYGQENNGSGVWNDELDELQLAFLDAAVKAGKPIFGICRGMQLMNVYFGGTLVQHIETYKDHARDTLTDPDKHHDAVVTGEKSYLYPLYGETFRINSSHHQVLDRLGDGIVVDLYSSEDHLVEGAHHESLPIWMVQWHPERCKPTPEQPLEVEGSKVLAFFLEQAAKHLNK